MAIGIVKQNIYNPHIIAMAQQSRLIDFNRTRYQLFFKDANKDEKTTTRKLLDKEFKKRGIR